MAEYPDNLPGEVWKPVSGWADLYEVSNLGRVKVLRRAKACRNRWGATVQTRPTRIMKPTISAFGHYFVNLHCDGKVKRRSVHRLVCEAFHGACPPDKQHCAHWDGNPANNRADNLRWATVKENSDDTRRHGNLRTGEASNLSRLTGNKVLEIRKRAAAGECLRQIAGEIGFTREGVAAIVARKTWKHL